MPTITSYNTGCKTKQTYENDGFAIAELTDGTVYVYNINTMEPSTQHETKPCCELLGYTFDCETQKCRWTEEVFEDDLFKIILNPEGNSSVLFSTEDNETCTLEVTFDYIFTFNCEDMSTARRTYGTSVISIENQISIDRVEAELYNLTLECEFYQDIINEAQQVPYVIQCLSQGVTGPSGSSLPSDPSIYYGASLPPLSYGEFDPNVVNYCLTEPEGLAKWKDILDRKRTNNNISTDLYQEWINSKGMKTDYDEIDFNGQLVSKPIYTCDDVKELVESEIQPGSFYSETCDYNIFDRYKAEETISQYQTKLNNCLTLKADKELELENLKINAGIRPILSGILIDEPCDEYIEMIEQFDASFTIEVLNKSTNRLETVYEETLLNIGDGNLYNYINSTTGNTGIIISGETGLMPTLKEADLFKANIVNYDPKDLCSLIRDTLVTDLFNQYLLTNPLPQTAQERNELLIKFTSWYQSEWLQHKTLITDPNIISLLENQEINITISVNNCCIPFSILLDRIKMNKVCTKVDNVERFISEPPKFELTKVIDNKKSWLSNTTPDERFFDLKYRGTEYDTNHHRLVINTKETDLNLSPSRAVEQDVWCYISDNNCILKGCLGTGETYNSFTCPSGYTLDIDGDSCTKTTTTGATLSATTYTIGPGVGLSRNIHYLSRGVIFVEDVTDNEWPIYWTGTTKNSWVGPYYNTDYLIDSNGNYLEHSGFGSVNFSDGSLKYSSPEAFSGIFSKFGMSGSDTIAGKLNPNILWGGTSAVVSGSSFVDVTGTVNSGRLLNASIWSNPGSLPILEWIGVSYCFELSETKTYRIGFAGDDNVRVKINGEYLINPELTPDHDININNNFSISYSRSIQSYLIMGIKLSSGKNIIEVEGYNNTSGIAGFVLEVYDATEAELKNIRYESELDSVRVFSTIDRVGTTFDLGENSGYSCPTGYALDNCITASTQCIKIERVTREDEQLDEYCLCPDYPQIVKDYENVTTELPLTASTNILDCADITTLVNSFSGVTTLEEIEVVKGRNVYALGTGTTTTFDGFWFAEENDGTIGVYEVNWISGSTNTFDNVSNQVTSACCQVIDSMFETYSDTFLQGVNNYPSITWDFNTNKCVYTKCGDSGCANLDDLLTTELSEIDTVNEFTTVLSSELIDVKNRQTISSYPTLRMLYDRYNTRSEEFCGNLSSKYDYFDMDKFGQTVGNYWVDLIEQVVPATTIWASTYAYKNTVFDQQKYKYRNNNIYFCDSPGPKPAVEFKPFDFLVLEYRWEIGVGGRDLDTLTAIEGTGDPWDGVNGSPIGPDGNNIGYSRGTFYANNGSGSAYYVGNNIATPFLIWGGDCIGCTPTREQVLIDFKQLATEYTSINEFMVDIKAYWQGLNPTDTGELEIKMTTYIDGTMSLDGQLGFTFTPNVGGGVVDTSSFNTGTMAVSISNVETLGQIKYNATTKKAGLFPTGGATTSPTVISSTPTTTGSASPAPTPLALASDSTVGVIIEILPNPNIIGTTTGSTVNLINLQPSITKCNGVWIRENNCESNFLGTVEVIDKNGTITEP